MRCKAMGVAAAERRRDFVSFTLAAVAVIVVSAAARADVVTLTTGDKLIGLVVSEGDDAVSLEHPVLGTLVIPRERVASVTLGEAAAPVEAVAIEEAADPVAAADTRAEEVAEAADDVADPVAEAEPERGSLFNLDWFLPGWTKQIEFGSSGQTGSNETFDVVFRANFDFEDQRTRWNYDAAYFYGISDGETDENEFTTSLRRDFLIPEERYFFFAQAGYEFDEFEDFDHRVTGGGGVGYMFVKRDNFFLDGRAGIGVITELGGEGDDSVDPEALFGIELGWDIDEEQTLAFSNTVFPSLDDFGEYRNVSELTYTLSIDRDNGVALRAGISNEFDSDQEEDPNEFRYFVTLVLDL